jgi:hypothetical protein
MNGQPLPSSELYGQAVPSSFFGISSCTISPRTRSEHKYAAECERRDDRAECKLYRNALKIIVKELQEERRTKEARAKRAAQRPQRREYSLQSEPWATMTVTSSNASPKEEK